MQWNSLSEFLAMGGYGLYVWGSFGTTAVVMLAEMAHARLQRKALLQCLRSETQSEHGTS
jgi:heme exporter protein D